MILHYRDNSQVHGEKTYLTVKENHVQFIAKIGYICI